MGGNRRAVHNCRPKGGARLGSASTPPSSQPDLKVAGTSNVSPARALFGEVSRGLSCVKARNENFSPGAESRSRASVSSAPGSPELSCPELSVTPAREGVAACSILLPRQIPCLFLSPGTWLFPRYPSQQHASRESSALMAAPGPMPLRWGSQRASSPRGCN